ncbi:MAG: 3-dehydroquinate dehydratase [Kiritimatiellae bacterium]|nr:3-dehydroquinate dehydratase [Kiritimatiellia bacterium]
MKILVINGPNLNLLGEREPEVYGRRTYAELVDFIRAAAAERGAEAEIRQTNHEGQIVDWIQECRGGFDALVINAAAYTHTSVAIHDAIRAARMRTVEVHLSDPKSREDFRRRSFIEPVAEKTCSGRGFESYADAIRHLTGGEEGSL